MYKSFAIAGGTGTIGKHVVEQFLSQEGVTVHVLTRKQSTTEDYLESWKSRGAIVSPVDYSSEESVSGALKGVDVLISAVGAGALGAQPLLVRAAKKAGVKLFVNSHFGAGFPPNTPGLDMIEAKQQAITVAQEVGLPYAEFLNGGFLDLVMAYPPFGFDFANRKVTTYGTGDEPIAWTTQTDIARYVLYVLTHLPASKLENRKFRIQGDSKAPNEIIKLWEAKHGEKIDVSCLPISILQENVKKSGGKDVLSAFLEQFAIGNAQFKEDDNDEYPDWHPKTVVDFL